jgi:Asp-tRNA(Asn)/Glu-tRNA(Gln) amidotransferase A subunit family amidase
MAAETTPTASVASYNPKAPGLITWHNAIPRFLDKSDTPRAYLERCIETIDDREPTVKAFVSIDLEVARKAADKATTRYKNNQPLSTVDGMPFVVKDLYEVKGMPTELGSPAMRGYGGDKDCAHARALREGGAAIIGKTVTTEFGSRDAGPTRNPFDIKRTPGGSSSGTSAAVGAGMVPAGSGSQVRGSILRPAGYCGNFAIKPTFGALNRLGGHSMSPSQSVLGVHGGSIEDVWGTAFYISSTAGGDPGHPGLYGKNSLGAAKKPTRLVRLDTLGWQNTENETKEKYEEFIRSISDKGVEIVSRREDAAIEVFEQTLHTIPDFLGDMFCWEMQWPGKTQRDKGEHYISEGILERIAHGETMKIEDYRRCLDMRQTLRESFDTIRGKGDAFILLSAQGPAPLASTGTGNPTFGDVTSCLGAPGYNLPLLEDRGMPMGIQIMGFPHQDFVLGKIGKWVSEELLT